MSDYVELHARSAFSFLRGGSSPEALGQACAARDLPGFALCDRGGFSGAARHYVSSREAGLRAWVGCELVLEDDTVVPVLVGSPQAYEQVCRLLTTVNFRSAKGEGRLSWAELSTLAEAAPALFALTGDEEGPVHHAWVRGGPAAATTAAERLLRCFGPHRLRAELQRHRLRREEAPQRWLIDWARARQVPLLATNGVRYADPASAATLDVLTCLRQHTTLAAAGHLLTPNRTHHLKDGATMQRLFADLPEAIHETRRLADQLDFTLAQLGYRFPDYPVPEGETQESFLHKMTYFGAQQRYGSVTGPVRRQLERELALIGRLGFSGYFLVVWDLCAYAREQDILVQGRGSAANSAVCYALGITAVDPLDNQLLFERFLSEGRSDWPDIDLDLPSGEPRERVIQEVYRRYGRRGAAMTANVITFKGRSTFREVGKVFALPENVLDRFSRLFHGGDYPHTLALADQMVQAGLSRDDPRLPLLLDTCQRLHGLPRHLGQHSGGMIISTDGLDRCAPLENAAMPGRTVLPWDKSDCEDLGIIKIDLLGLGMMAVLQESLHLCAEQGRPVDLARIPKDDPATFALLQAADTIGVFQVESRAQMATLPRLKPVTFYDLAVEVAIIRPGPIHGDAVHPYLARRAGTELVRYPDERARPILERTLGVVLFQEQILRLAMELGGFSAAEADELRRAIGFTRSTERLEKMQRRLREALTANAVSPEAIEMILHSLASFALYGFPESHAISFALLAYASAWLKVHRPAEFYAALLNHQPMGFYAPASLVQDGKRRGLRFLPVCVVESAEACRVLDATTVRLGLRSLPGLSESSRQKILSARARQPFLSLGDFVHRTQLPKGARQLLAEAGALQALSTHRREALWAIEALHPEDTLFQQAVAEAPPAPPQLPPMTRTERVAADYRTVGYTVGTHPMALVRERLPHLWRARQLTEADEDTPLWVGGAVTSRQRPGTAKGVCFLTLEDETGLTNVIVWPALFEQRRNVINLEAALCVYGRVQRQHGVLHLIAEELTPLAAAEVPAAPSHDYH